MKVAVIWHNFGNYHLNRFDRIAGVFGQDSTFGIQIARRSSRYKWRIDDSQLSSRNISSIFSGEYQDRNLVQRVFCIFKLISHLNKLNPSVLFIPGYGFYFSLIALNWAKFKGKQVIMFFESKLDDAPRKVFYEKIKGIFIRDNFIFCGANIHRDYAIKLGAPIDLVKRNFLVVDNEVIRANSEANKSKYQVKYGDYLLASGRFIERKNFRFLIEVFARLRAQGYSHLNLVIIGEGPEKYNLEQVVLEHRLEDDVYFPGWVEFDELGGLYGGAKAFVHPAYSEAWGLVINEAMAAGCPVLMSRKVGAASELLQKNELGFDPFDHLSCLNAVDGFLGLANDDVDGIIDHGLTVVTTNFSLDAFEKTCVEFKNELHVLPRSNLLDGLRIFGLTVLCFPRVLN